MYHLAVLLVVFSEGFCEAVGCMWKRLVLSSVTPLVPRFKSSTPGLLGIGQLYTKGDR